MLFTAFDLRGPEALLYGSEAERKKRTAAVSLPRFCHYVAKKQSTDTPHHGSGYQSRHQEEALMGALFLFMGMIYARCRAASRREPHIFYGRVNRTYFYAKQPEKCILQPGSLLVSFFYAGKRKTISIHGGAALHFSTQPRFAFSILFDI